MNGNIAQPVPEVQTKLKINPILEPEPDAFASQVLSDPNWAADSENILIKHLSDQFSKTHFADRTVY